MEHLSSTPDMQDSAFDLNTEVANILGEEAAFYSKAEFKTVVTKYLEKHVEARRRKTFFFRSDYNLAVRRLREDNDKDLWTSQNRSWIRCTFFLKEFGTPLHPNSQLGKKQSEIPVCPYDCIYSILCKLHDGVHNHVGQKAMWRTVCV